MSIAFKGIVPALITPMTADENVDEDGLRALVERLIEAGVHGLFVLGSVEKPSAYEDLPFRSRPLYYGKPWFLPLAVQFYEMLDRWEQR